MSRFEKMLRDWVSHGLITNEQAKKISLHENAKPGSSWVLYGFLILGAMIVGIGIVSVIAANWKYIPDALKLSIDFLFLIALASGAYLAWEKKKSILFHTIYPHETSKVWVVFIHGAGGSSAIWFRQLRAYQKKYNILLLDLRGHGKSTNLVKTFVDSNYSFNKVSEDIIGI